MHTLLYSMQRWFAGVVDDEATIFISQRKNVGTGYGRKTSQSGTKKNVCKNPLCLLTVHPEEIPVFTYLWKNYRLEEE